MYDALPGVDVAKKLHWRPGERVRHMISFVFHLLSQPKKIEIMAMF